MAEVAAGADKFAAIFFDEVQEHLANTESLLLGMDIRAPEPDDMNGVFRAVHSIKGSAAMLGFDDMSALAHVMENLLDLLRKGERPLVQEDIDTMLQAGDALRAHVDYHRGAVKTQPDGSPMQALLRARVQFKGAGDASP